MVRLSIVVPSFNQGEYLEDCLLSILNSSGDPEILVLDGGSTDGSLDILKKYSKDLHFWRSRPDDGQSAAIAEGFEIATGNVLGWLNSDDRYTPGSLSTVRDYFSVNLDVNWAFGNSNKIDASGALLHRRFVPPTNFNELMSTNLFLPQESTFFRRDFYYSIGGIDPALHMAMDYDLWLRMAQFAKPGKINGFIGEFRLHNDQKSQNVESYNLEVAIVKSRMNSTESLKSKTHRLTLLRKARIFAMRLRENPLKFIFIERPRECFAVIRGRRQPGQSVALAYLHLSLYFVLILVWLMLLVNL